MLEIMNDRRFGHNCHNGTVFESERCDFKTPVYYDMTGNITVQQLMTDVAEMIGYHATVIWPHLNGFSGYDAVRFEPKVK